MFGINRTIFENSNRYLNRYGLDDLDRGNYRQLLSTPWENSETRKSLAAGIADDILSKHGKGEAFRRGFITLADIETHIKELVGVRDHVVHSALLFLLGAYLIERLGLEVSPLEWKLCAFLHDLGYPFEMALNLPKVIEEELSNFSDRLEVNSPELKSRWVFKNLEKLTGEPSSFVLLSRRFRKWNVRFRSKELYNDMVRSGKVNHGIVSALLVMKLTDMLYAHHNPGRIETLDSETINRHNGVDFSYRHFENHIINASSSIFLHNLGQEHFNDQSLNIEEHTLPCLLKLADELQDWERPSKTGEEVYTASDYSIRVSSDPKWIDFGVPSSRLNDFRRIVNIFEGVDLQVFDSSQQPQLPPM